MWCIILKQFFVLVETAYKIMDLYNSGTGIIINFTKISQDLLTFLQSSTHTLCLLCYQSVIVLRYCLAQSDLYEE